VIQIRTAAMDAMNSMLLLEQFERLGYVILPSVLNDREADALATRLETALQTDAPSILRSRGKTYGSRDLINLFPEVCEIPLRPGLKEFVVAVLGPSAGLVRALYFDKPPERSWSLPWHKDWTIAVKNNSHPSKHFRRPTTKAGIPHVEASKSLLAGMLTLRLHLDPMTAENGPLCVIPGSHTTEVEDSSQAVEIHTKSGDVLAMRPLVSHSSIMSIAETTMHRRVIHLEFAPSIELPDGYEWHSFRMVG
jgi:Phytanoyl-CoA dioxygenase (PhyH)